MSDSNGPRNLLLFPDLIDCVEDASRPVSESSGVEAEVVSMAVFRSQRETKDHVLVRARDLRPGHFLAEYKCFVWNLNYFSDEDGTERVRAIVHRIRRVVFRADELVAVRSHDEPDANGVEAEGPDKVSFTFTPADTVPQRLIVNLATARMFAHWWQNAVRAAETWEHKRCVVCQRKFCTLLHVGQLRAFSVAKDGRFVDRIALVEERLESGRFRLRWQDTEKAFYRPADSRSGRLVRYVLSEVPEF